MNRHGIIHSKRLLYPSHAQKYRILSTKPEVNALLPQEEYTTITGNMHRKIHNLGIVFEMCATNIQIYTVSQKKTVLTLKRYSSKLQGAILMKFGRNIQNTLE